MNTDRKRVQQMFLSLIACWGHAVAQSVKALRYKPKGRGFGSRWCHWSFSLAHPSGLTMAVGSTRSLTETWVPGIFPRGKGGRCVWLTTLPPYFNLVASTTWNPQGLYAVCFTSYLYWILTDWISKDETRVARAWGRKKFYTKFLFGFSMRW